MKNILIVLLISCCPLVSQAVEVHEFRIVQGAYTKHIVDDNYNEDNNFKGFQIVLIPTTDGISYGIEYAEFVNSYDDPSRAGGVFGSTTLLTRGKLKVQTSVSLGLIKGYEPKDIEVDIFFADNVMIYASNAVSMVYANTVSIGARTLFSAISLELGYRF